MAIVTLDEVKAHLRVTDSAADPVLTVHIDVVEDYLARIGCAVDADPVPPALKGAALLGVQQIYAASGDVAVTKEQVTGIGGTEYDRTAADKILSAALDRLIASVREVKL